MVLLAQLWRLACRRVLPSNFCFGC
jgi:hypothetical protein